MATITGGEPRPAAGAPEQRPVGGASVGVQVMEQEPDELRGIGTVLLAPLGRCLRPRGSRGVPVPSRLGRVLVLPMASSGRG